MMRIALLTAAAILVSACEAGTEEARFPNRFEVSPMVLAGESLARRHCAECHTIRGFANSPLPDAPPFASLAVTRDLSTFTRAYNDGLFEGHPRMPLVELDPDELAELTAFLDDLD